MINQLFNVNHSVEQLLHFTLITHQPINMTTSNPDNPNPNHNRPDSNENVFVSQAKQENPTNKFINISFVLIITYLLLKLIILPVTQTAINIIPNLSQPDKITVENIKSPELSFPDILLFALIFLFQPQSAKIFDSLDVSSTGVSAKFRQLKAEVDETKEAIDEEQEKQLKKIQQLQQLMFPLILTKNEVKQLQGLKKHTIEETPFQFKIYSPAAKELRRLRDSKLIKVKKPHQYIADIQEAGKNGEQEIDLTQYCELTKLGTRFLAQYSKFSVSEEADDLLYQDE
jgi:hypothetical protein